MTILLEKKIVSFLLFVPLIFALSVPHWLSGWFLLFLLLGVGRVWFCKPSWRLDKQTKILLWLGLAIFLSTLLSNALAGWTNANIERFEVDLKQFLSLFLLVYLASFKDCFKWFFRALPMVAIILFLTIFVLDDMDRMPRNIGTYGTIFFGNWSALLFFLILFSKQYAKWHSSRLGLFLQYAGLLSAFITTIVAGSRNGWLTFVILGFISLFFYRRLLTIKHYVIGFLFFSLSIFLIGQTFIGDYVKNRLAYAYVDVKTYLENPYTHEQKNVGNQDFRLTQWKATLDVFHYKAWFGYGAGGTSLAMNKAVAEKLAPKFVAVKNPNDSPTHVHNGYLTTLLDKGLIGLFLKMAFLLFILWAFWQCRKENRDLALLGVLFISAYLIFSLTEVPLIRNNHTAIFFLCLSVLWNLISSPLNNKKENDLYK